MQKKYYTIIVPRLDNSGPTSVAVDIGNIAVFSGWNVKLLYLSGALGRNDINSLIEVRKFRISDLWSLKGIVHTHMFRPDLIGWLCSCFGRTKIITTLHGHCPHHLAFDYTSFKVNLAWYLWAYVIQRFHVRICISKAMQRHYKRIFPKLKFELVYNFRSSYSHKDVALSSEILDWIDRQRSENKFVLVYVGSLIKRKNILPLVKKLGEFPEFSLIICGDGPLRSEIESVARMSGTDSIFISGQLPCPDLVIRLSDLLVLPSHAEGLALVILEAARLGIPSLLSNIAVHRELEIWGLGKTFDRYTFADFSEKAFFLLGARIKYSDKALIKIWEDFFSPEQGFSKYEHHFRALYF